MTIPSSRSAARSRDSSRRPEVAYGLSTSRFNVVPRTDGLVVRSKSHTGDFNNSNDAPDPAESEAAVREIASVFGNMRRL